MSWGRGVGPNHVSQLSHYEPDCSNLLGHFVYVSLANAAGTTATNVVAIDFKNSFENLFSFAGATVGRNRSCQGGVPKRHFNQFEW